MCHESSWRAIVEVVDGASTVGPPSDHRVKSNVKFELVSLFG
jgi:hypothetical protein